MDSRIKNLFDINAISIDDKYYAKLVKYYANLQKWNEKINITRNDDPLGFFEKNIIDILLALRVFQKNPNYKREGYTLIDAGCGGGFLGILWRLFDDGCKNVHLVDSSRKRINFCKQTIRDLEVENAFCHHSRLEDFLETGVEFDVLASRATWSYNDIIKSFQEFIGGDQIILALTGPRDGEGEHGMAYHVRPSGLRHFVNLWKRDKNTT